MSLYRLVKNIEYSKNCIHVQIIEAIDRQKEHRQQQRPYNSSIPVAALSLIDLVDAKSHQRKPQKTIQILIEFQSCYQGIITECIHQGSG